MMKRQSSHVVSGAFVFLLLGVFAVFSTVMVLLGAQLYRVTVEDSRIHSARRVAESYLLNIVRGNDAAGAVSVQQLGEIPALVFAWDVDGEIYETKVYCHEGALRELFGSAGDAFRPDYGEAICEAAAFTPSLNGNLLTMELVHGDGQARTLRAALRCGAEIKEAQP